MLRFNFLIILCVVFIFLEPSVSYLQCQRQNAANTTNKVNCQTHVVVPSPSKENQPSSSRVSKGKNLKSLKVPKGKNRESSKGSEQKNQESLKVSKETSSSVSQVKNHVSSHFSYEDSVVYKDCSAQQVDSPVFLQERDEVFAYLVRGGQGKSRSGFRSAQVQRLQGSSQCKDELTYAECSICVYEALQQVSLECPFSLHAQLYLHLCYVSYSYVYPQPIPHSKPPQKDDHKSPNRVDSRTIAIVIGACAAAVFVFVILLFLKSLCREDDD